VSNAVSPEQGKGPERWLLTGGAGYIGSHVIRALQAAGHAVVVLDDLSTGELDRVPADVPTVIGSVSDEPAVRAALLDYDVQGVIHLAAKKSVEESVADPLRYWTENVGGLAALLRAMRSAQVSRLVFSSSAAVYGTPEVERVDEAARTAPESPYGRTKLVGEWMVRDAAAGYGISAVCLRYFNVVGCGSPQLADGKGANLFPRVLFRMAQGLPVTVFGGDYPTTDGTCMRDYVHVQDLAEAHVAAADLTALPGCDEVINVGTGRGYSVLEVLEEFGRTSGATVAHVITERRAGDPVAMIADVSRAAGVLDWSARFDLGDMVSSAWRAARIPASSPMTSSPMTSSPAGKA
jgi:UDP-glucose 4-epimerase